MKLFKSALFAVGLVLILSYRSVVLADGPVDVDFQGNAMTVTPVAQVNFMEMYVRITGPANSGTTEYHSVGEPVVWAHSEGSTAGRYTYKVLVKSTEASHKERQWASGSFDVSENGELIHLVGEAEGDD